jgi:hypothetical protein
MRVKLKKYKTIIFLLKDEIESQKTVIKGEKNQRNKDRMENIYMRNYN